MKKGTILHYIIGVCALALTIAAIYYIYKNPDNLISAGIVAFAGSLVAISQYFIIKQKNKK